MEFNLADLFEHAVDNFGDREYLVVDGTRRTYAELEARANRLAHHLASQGIGAGDHVGIYAYNSVEWVETLWAVFKLRAVWVNINYRYVEDELRYLVGNADLKAIVGAYQQVIAEHSGEPFPQDPRTQMDLAVQAVFNSWNTPKAIYYRRMEKIPDSIGTAANVQAMVFGNMGEKADLFAPRYICFGVVATNGNSADGVLGAELFQ